jgi:hypothetical protein
MKIAVDVLAAVEELGEPDGDPLGEPDGEPDVVTHSFPPVTAEFA